MRGDSDFLCLPNLGKVILDFFLKYDSKVFEFQGALPLPPTANHRLTPIRGRQVKGAKYRAYQKDVAKFKGVWKLFIKPVSLHIDVYQPTKAGDIDSRLKALLDALTGVIYEDDKLIKHLHVVKEKDSAFPRVEIICYEL